MNLQRRMPFSAGRRLAIGDARGARGFVLFESMISVLVVSAGFLAFAGLQINGLAASNSALLRSKAVYLSYQMADRVRANRPAAEAGGYSNLTGTVSDPGCLSSSCTAAQMAQTDFVEWSNEVSSSLPDGAGVVCVDSVPEHGTPASPDCDNVGDALAIKIWWTEKGVTSLFVTTFRP